MDLIIRRKNNVYGISCKPGFHKTILKPSEPQPMAYFIPDYAIAV
jgi:hypothetical protein